MSETKQIQSHKPKQPQSLESEQTRSLEPENEIEFEEDELPPARAGGRDPWHALDDFDDE